MADNEQAPGSRADDSLFDAAEEWAGRRPQKALILELFVRVVQVAGILKNLCEYLGLGPDGLAPNAYPRAVHCPECHLPLGSGECDTCVEYAADIARTRQDEE